MKRRKEVRKGSEAAERGIAAEGASPESVFETLGGKMSAKKLREQISKLLAG